MYYLHARDWRIRRGEFKTNFNQDAGFDVVHLWFALCVCVCAMAYCSSSWVFSYVGRYSTPVLAAKG